MTNLPITGVFNITATYGQQGKYWANGHKGLDITCANRTIYATCDGTVRVVAYDANGWGYYVSIGDSQGRRHIFCHLVKGSIKVTKGQKVNRSTVIGTMGTTGNSTGIHLHYQINDANGNPINPCPYLGVPNEKGKYNSANYQIDKEEFKYKDDSSIADWAKNAVYELHSKGIMTGDTSSNFNPKNKITRQEAAVAANSTIDYCGLSFPNIVADTKYFDDAAIGNWAKNAVYNLKKKAIMSGSNSMFYPINALTRQEAAVIINKIYNKNHNIGNVEKYKDDKKIASWAKNAVYNLRAAGLMSGQGDNTFNPTAPITRQEMAVLLNGLVKKLGK